MKQLLMTDDVEEIPHREDPPLKVVRTSGRPPKNWLRELPEGTVFHSRLRNNPPFNYDWICTQYRVIKQYQKSTSLWDVMADEHEYSLVDSELFSDQNICVEVITYGYDSS